MGWTDSHLHEFSVGEATYGDPAVDVNMEDHVKDEKKFRLSQVV